MSPELKIKLSSFALITFMLSIFHPTTTSSHGKNLLFTKIATISLIQLFAVSPIKSSLIGIRASLLKHCFLNQEVTTY